MTRKLVTAIGIAGILSAFGAVPASAADGTPPPTAASVCDAGHGAFGAFSHHFDGGVNWISIDAREDDGLGASTGAANSALGQTCRTTNP